MVKVSFWLTLLAALGAAACGLVRPAGAHSWYDPWCCNGGDCGPARVDGFVAASAAARPAMQVSNHKGTAVVEAQTRFLSSKDHQLHACIYMGRLRCVYLPPGN